MSEVATTTTRELAERYSEAWNSHDLDAIMALHAPDSIFCLHMTGDEVRGDDVRTAFAGILALWPDIHFETRRLHACESHFVSEYVMSGTLAQAIPIGGRTIEPTGRPIAIDGTDVIPVGDGLVQRKDTYLDLVAGLQQMGAFEGQAG